MEIGASALIVNTNIAENIDEWNIALAVGPSPADVGSMSHTLQSINVTGRMENPQYRHAGS